jgi:hypothetical protein
MNQELKDMSHPHPHHNVEEEELKDMKGMDTLVVVVVQMVPRNPLGVNYLH